MHPYQQDRKKLYDKKLFKASVWYSLTVEKKLRIYRARDLEAGIMPSQFIIISGNHYPIYMCVCIF